MVERKIKIFQDSKFFFLLSYLAATLTAETVVRKPEFGEVLPNITVAVGRDATLPCVVKHLQDYKVKFYIFTVL